MKNIFKYLTLSAVAVLLGVTSADAAYQPAAGTNGQIQYNNNGAFGGLTSIPITNGGNTYNAIVTAAPYNASGYIAQTVTSSAVSAGTNVIPVNSSIGFFPGDVVIIASGGTVGNINYIDTIASVGVGSITLSGASITGPPNTLWEIGVNSGGTSLTTAVPSGQTVFTLAMLKLTGAVANGVCTLPVTNSSSYNAGEGILVYGGGVSGVNLVSTIASTTSTSITLQTGSCIANASGVASGAYIQHDDTVAFQTALNLASPLQSINIYVPDGVYQINGPSTNPSTDAAALQIPSIPYYDVATFNWFPMATINIQGNVSAPEIQGYLATHIVPHWNGAIVQTNISGYSLIAGYSATSLANITNVKFVTKNITWRTQPNPNLQVLNLYGAAQIDVEHFSIDTGNSFRSAQPTTPKSGTPSLYNAGLVTPIRDNGGNNIVDDGSIMGYYGGVSFHEHTRLSHLRLDNDFYPLIVADGSTTAQYGTTGVEIEFNSCPHGILAAGGPTELEISLLNLEHHTNPSWVTNIDDVADPTNLLYGSITVDVDSNNPTEPTITGAAYLNVVNNRNVGNLAGTTAGTVIYAQPQLSGPTGKTFTSTFTGYENNTATNQTITFPIAFANSAAKTVDTCTGLGLTTTVTSNAVFTITAPAVPTTYSCYVEVHGN